MSRKTPMHTDLLPGLLDPSKDLAEWRYWARLRAPRSLWSMHDARCALMNVRLMDQADLEELPDTQFQTFLSFVGACVEGRTAVGRLDPRDTQERSYLADLAEDFGLEWLVHTDGCCFTPAEVFDYYAAWLSAREEGRSLEIAEWDGAERPTGYGE